MNNTLSDVSTSIGAGDFNTAREMLRGVLQDDPSAEAYYLAAQVATNDQQVRQFLTKAVELDPFHPTAAIELEAFGNLAPAPAEHEPMQNQPEPLLDSNGSKVAQVSVGSKVPMSQSATVTAGEPQKPAEAVVKKKSGLVAFLLTFFFGPFGMFYSTVSGALLMIVISLILFFLTSGFSLPFTWIASIIWGVWAVTSQSKQTNE